MIQRIQTVYIMLGMLLVLVTGFFLPHATCVSDELFIKMSYAGLIFLIIFFINSLIAILKFNNRKKQIYYIKGNLIAIPLLLLTIYIFDFFIVFNTDFLGTEIISNDTSYIHNWIFDIGMMLGFFCFFLAKKAIKKDEDLINSINRLR